MYIYNLIVIHCTHTVLIQVWSQINFDLIILCMPYNNYYNIIILLIPR